MSKDNGGEAVFTRVRKETTHTKKHNETVGHQRGDLKSRQREQSSYLQKNDN